MPTPSRILDGAPPFGTNSVTMVTSAVTYIVNSETITPNWGEAENRTANAGPNQALYVKGRYSYSGEWQLGTSGTAYPVPGDTFTRTVPNEGSSVTFVVTETPFEYTNEVAIRVAKVTAKQAIGTITTA